MTLVKFDQLPPSLQKRYGDGSTIHQIRALQGDKFKIVLSDGTYTIWSHSRLSGWIIDFGALPSSPARKLPTAQESLAAAERDCQCAGGFDIAAVIESLDDLDGKLQGHNFTCQNARAVISALRLALVNERATRYSREGVPQ